jgi:hypothetical protein
MAAMESDRFDDVSYEILEGPEPPRAPRARGRRTAALTGLALAFGALAAAAALAVTGPSSTPPPKAPAAPPAAEFNADGVPIYHHGTGCKHGMQQRDKYPARGHRHDVESFAPRY